MEFPVGWTCERTVLQFERYLKSTIALADSLAVAEHLEACVGCAQRLVLLRVTLSRPTRG